MPVSALPIAAVSPGNVLTSTNWNAIVKDNLNKLLNTGHRVLTVAQFGALVAPEGTKGTVAPDEVYLEVDSANGVEWHLAFESGEPTYKWRYIGGPPMVSFVATNESTVSSAYVALTTAGPSIALPRAGDFDVKLEAGIAWPVGAGVGFGSVMSYDIGATAAVDADSLFTQNPVNSATSAVTSCSRTSRKTGLTAVTLTAKYKSTAGTTAAFQNRSMSVTPVRLI